MKKIMNKLTKTLTNKLNPKAGLIVYKQQDSNQFYIELRKIKNGIFEAAQPMPESFLHTLVKSMNASQTSEMYKSAGLMPKNILYLDQQNDKFELMWYKKPGKQMLHFTKGLNIPSGECDLPGLIFHYKNNNLYVFAVKRQPSERTVLFRGPFFNVEDSGYVCLGNAHVTGHTEKTFECFMLMMHLLFFASEFSHLNGTNPIKGNLSAVYRKLSGTKEKFPLDQLKATKLTIKKYIQNLQA